jgi:FkbM family methyltransferase
VSTLKQNWAELKETIHKARAPYHPSEQPFVVYCAGDRGKYAYFTLRDLGYKVLGFVDGDRTKYGGTFHGLPVFAPNRIPLGAYVVVAVQTLALQKKIKHTLGGFDAATIGEFIFPPVLHRLDAVYDMLADDWSRDVFYHVIMAHYEQDSKHFKPVFEDRQYWCIGYAMHNVNKHIFVDAGAYTGDTMADFACKTRGKFTQVIAFEPTPELFKQVQERKAELMKVWNLTDDHFDIVHGGLGEFDGTMALCMKDSDPNGAGNSFYNIAERKGDEVKVWSLDSYLQGKPVTFIKADIEGFELDMLRGAKETIKAHKPDLAICVYHKMSDLWEIPRYVNYLVPEYRLYLRHHHHDYSETVLYASVI